MFLGLSLALSAKCNYDECRGAESRGAECRGANEMAYHLFP